MPTYDHAVRRIYHPLFFPTMNRPINFIQNDQVELFNQLNRHQVRYLAFGSFSINSYEQARTEGTVKLWVEPTGENLRRLNEVLLETGQSTLRPDFDPERRRPLEPVAGAATRDRIGVDFYPAVNGFTLSDFGRLYERREKVPAQELARHPHDQSVPINHLSLPDLYHNTGHTRGKAKEYNLTVLFKAAGAFGVQAPDLPPPSSYLPLEQDEREQQKSDGASLSKSLQSVFQKRDFQQIRQDLDLEVVLQHYGYQLSSKTRPKDVWRVYKSGFEGDSQRFAVMTNPKSGYKGFVELNNTSLRGDVFEFIRYKEGDYRSAFRVVDEILGNPRYEQQAAQVAPLTPARPRQYLQDEKLRQSDLIREYGISHPDRGGSDYLTNSRMLGKETVNTPEFRHQILSTVRGGHTNVAFPLTSAKGNILSLDIRNENFKSFPPGAKGDALWKSNEHAILAEESTCTVGTEPYVLAKGTRGTLSRTNGLMTFHTRHPEAGDLSVPVDKTRITVVPANRIIISESPIDSLSYHQLAPPQPGEYRRYVSPAGNPSREQIQQLESFVGSHPQAQFVVGMDGDPAGNRFAINLLGTKHPQRNDRFAIIPHVVYNNPTPATGEGGKPKESKEVGHNLLTLEIRHPIAREATYEHAKSENESVIERLLDKMNLFQPRDKKAVETLRENLIETGSQTLRTVSEIKFPNRGRLLESALDQLATEIEIRDGQKLTAVIRPTATQNDFNEVLRNRSGKSLPESSNLALGKVPELAPLKKELVQEAKSQKPQKRQSAELAKEEVQNRKPVKRL
ncbi:MAG: toprim domain-containing protein [Bacteroidetes bacterium]|nr:toprim domain-containing protein [Bacteroidota bacterium]